MLIILIILDLITRVTPRTPDTLGLFFDAFADALHRTQVALDARVIGQCWEYLLQKFTLSFMASDDEPIDGYEIFQKIFIYLY